MTPVAGDTPATKPSATSCHGSKILWTSSPASAGCAGKSRSLIQFADDPLSAQLFRETRGSTADGPVDLPWLDAERAVLIAVNRRPGDDVAVALDYRTDPTDPRIVASDFWTNPKQCTWRMVSPTFSQLVDQLGIRPA